jgi:transposase
MRQILHSIRLHKVHIYLTTDRLRAYNGRFSLQPTQVTAPIPVNTGGIKHEVRQQSYWQPFHVLSMFPIMGFNRRYGGRKIRPHWSSTLGELIANGDEVLADRGYDADWIRELIADQGCKAQIPPKSNRFSDIAFSKHKYRSRGRRPLGCLGQGDHGNRDRQSARRHCHRRRIDWRCFSDCPARRRCNLIWRDFP